MADLTAKTPSWVSRNRAEAHGQSLLDDMPVVTETDPGTPVSMIALSNNVDVEDAVDVLTSFAMGDRMLSQNQLSYNITDMNQQPFRHQKADVVERSAPAPPTAAAPLRAVSRGRRQGVYMPRAPFTPEHARRYYERRQHQGEVPGDENGNSVMLEGGHAGTNGATGSGQAGPSGHGIGHSAGPVHAGVLEGPDAPVSLSETALAELAVLHALSLPPVGQDAVAVDGLAAPLPVPGQRQGPVNNGRPLMARMAPVQATPATAAYEHSSVTASRPGTSNVTGGPLASRTAMDVAAALDESAGSPGLLYGPRGQGLNGQGVHGASVQPRVTLASNRRVGAAYGVPTMANGPGVGTGFGQAGASGAPAAALGQPHANPTALDASLYYSSVPAVRVLAGAFEEAVEPTGPAKARAARAFAESGEGVEAADIKAGEGLQPSKGQALVPALPAAQPSASVPAPDPAAVAAASEWRSAQSPEGKTYYFHKRTRQTCWELPSGIEAALVQPSRYTAKTSGGAASATGTAAIAPSSGVAVPAVPQHHPLLRPVHGAEAGISGTQDQVQAYGPAARFGRGRSSGPSKFAPGAAVQATAPPVAVVTAAPPALPMPSASVQPRASQQGQVRQAATEIPVDGAAADTTAVGASHAQDSAVLSPSRSVLSHGRLALSPGRHGGISLPLSPSGQPYESAREYLRSLIVQERAARRERSRSASNTPGHKGPRPVRDGSAERLGPEYGTALEAAVEEAQDQYPFSPASVAPPMPRYGNRHYLSSPEAEGPGMAPEADVDEDEARLQSLRASVARAVQDVTQQMTSMVLSPGRSAGAPSPGRGAALSPGRDAGLEYNQHPYAAQQGLEQYGQQGRGHDGNRDEEDENDEELQLLALTSGKRAGGARATPALSTAQQAVPRRAWPTADRATLTVQQYNLQQGQEGQDQHGVGQPHQAYEFSVQDQEQEQEQDEHGHGQGVAHGYNGGVMRTEAVLAPATADQDGLATTTAAEDDPEVRVGCPDCGRHFHPSRLPVHAKACKQVWGTRRSPYPTHAVRLKDTPASSLNFTAKTVPPCAYCGKKFPVESDAKEHGLACKKRQHGANAGQGVAGHGRRASVMMNTTGQAWPSSIQGGLQSASLLDSSAISAITIAPEASLMLNTSRVSSASAVRGAGAALSASRRLMYGGRAASAPRMRGLASPGPQQPQQQPQQQLQGQLASLWPTGVVYGQGAVQATPVVPTPAVARRLPFVSPGPAEGEAHDQAAPIGQLGASMGRAPTYPVRVRHSAMGGHIGGNNTIHERSDADTSGHDVSGHLPGHDRDVSAGLLYGPGGAAAGPASLAQPHSAHSTPPKAAAPPAVPSPSAAVVAGSAPRATATVSKVSTVAAGVSPADPHGLLTPDPVPTSGSSGSAGTGSTGSSGLNQRPVSSSLALLKRKLQLGHGQGQGGAAGAAGPRPASRSQSGPRSVSPRGMQEQEQEQVLPIHAAGPVAVPAASAPAAPAVAAAHHQHLQDHGHDYGSGHDGADEPSLLVESPALEADSMNAQAYGGSAGSTAGQVTTQHKAANAAAPAAAGPGSPCACAACGLSLASPSALVDHLGQCEGWAARLAVEEAQEQRAEDRQLGRAGHGARAVERVAVHNAAQAAQVADWRTAAHVASKGPSALSSQPSSENPLPFVSRIPVPSAARRAGSAARARPDIRAAQAQVQAQAEPQVQQAGYYAVGAQEPLPAGHGHGGEHRHVLSSPASKPVARALFFSPVAEQQQDGTDQQDRTQARQPAYGSGRRAADNIKTRGVHGAGASGIPSKAGLGVGLGVGNGRAAVTTLVSPTLEDPLGQVASPHDGQTGAEKYHTATLAARGGRLAALAAAAEAAAANARAQAEKAAAAAALLGELQQVY